MGFQFERHNAGRIEQKFTNMGITVFGQSHTFGQRKCSCKISYNALERRPTVDCHTHVA